MGNHVHVIASPPEEDALAKCLGRTHVDYARWLNVRRGESGHVWQNRFFSCPMDHRHTWEALRYVELNPVRAGSEEFIRELEAVRCMPLRPPKARPEE